MEKLHEVLDGMSRAELIDMIERLCEDDDALRAKVCGFVPVPQGESQTKVQSQIRYYWHLAKDLLEEADAADWSYLEEVYNALDMIDELAEQEELSWNWRRALVDEMLECLNGANSRFRYALIDTSGALCKTEEEQQYLERSIGALGL